MLTFKEVARIFDVRPDTVKQWHRLGRLRSSGSAVNGGPLFRREDVILPCTVRGIRVPSAR